MLSDNIRNYRKSNNMSQDELAEKLDVSRQSISLWETGQTQPTLENIVSLAKIFNISADELLNEPGSAAKAKNKNGKKKIAILLSIIIVTVLVFVTAVLLWLNSDIDSTGQNNGASQPRIVKQAAVESSSKNNKVSSRKTTIAAKSKQSQNTNDDQQEVQTATPAKTVDLFSYFKHYAIKNGITSGDHSYISKTADTYGGNYEEDFSLYYWADSDKVEFCLHSVIDDTYSINFYIYVPQDFTGSYSYLTSYYYRESGESVYEAKGTIKAADFNKSYPLNCTRYIGPVEDQTAYMEISRQGICDLIDCIKNFAKKENLEFNIHDMGFVNF